MATRKLEVVITGDATQLQQTLGKVSDQASGFGSAMKKAALPATVALGAVAVGAKRSTPRRTLMSRSTRRRWCSATTAAKCSGGRKG
jgi:hypothetical protein